MDLERYRELAYGTALSLLGDHHLAEDAVQEAFFEAHRGWDSLREPEKRAAWVRAIVRRRCFRLLRRRARYSGGVLTWLRRIALAVGAFLLAVLLGEVAVRLVPGEPAGHHHRLFCEFDPDLGWRKIRNGGGRHKTAEYDVEESFNSEGLRGPDFAVPKPPGTKRILLLGDSFVEGYTVAFHDTVGEVIARETGVEVINGGTGGYGTDQELIFFERDGRRYGPDVTILFFYVNDVWSNANDRYWRGSKPRFRIGDGGALVRHDAELAPPGAGDRATAWLERNSHLFRLAGTTLRLLRERDPTAPPFRVYRTEREPEIEEAWALTVRLLEELATRVRAAHSEFVVVLIPPIFRVDDAAPRPEGDDPGRVERELAAACARLGVPFVNPIEPLRASAEPAYFPLDRHWNARGHAIAGKTVAAAIERMVH